VLFLRNGGTRGGEDEDGEQANDSTHQQLFFLWICVALVARWATARARRKSRGPSLLSGEKRTL
jgi:hypothetical protein